MKPLLFKDLGIIEYKEAWDIQENIFNNIINTKINNRNNPTNDQAETESHLFFCEHNHVYTLGKSGDINNLLINSIQLKGVDATFYKTNRGGDITYHGPGQIVGYPVIDLDVYSPNIHQYIYNIEEVIILTLNEYNLKAERLKGATGVWLDVNSLHPRKICAIGVKTSRWVSMHGWAFNVNTDLKYFDYINPCGFVDKGVTSLEKELKSKIDIDEVKLKLKKYFEIVFKTKLVG